MPPIDPDTRQRAEEALGYRFVNPRYLEEALTHASIAENRLASNERLEFLGDSILGSVVCEYLFHHFTGSQEGDLTKVKSAVVSRRTCAEISQGLGLVELLRLGKGMNGRTDLPSSVAAAVFESLIGAIYLDGGREPAQIFILRHIVPFIDEASESAHQQNFKSLLQQHAQRHMSALPTYALLDEQGPDHSKEFRVAAVIAGRRFEPAWGPNKKEAEQQAALVALRDLGLVRIEPDGQVHMTDEPAASE